MRNATSFLIVLGVLVCGCKSPIQDQQTIWTAESRSSDGTSIATASRVDIDGPGINDLSTTVDLKRTIYGNPPETVATFDQDQVGLPDAAKLNLAMNWVTPSRLDITYNGRAGTLIYQVSLYLGINITVHDTSSGSR